MYSANSRMGERKSEFKPNLSFPNCKTWILITSLLPLGLFWSRNEATCMKAVCRQSESTQNRHYYEVKAEMIVRQKKGLLDLMSRGEDPQVHTNFTWKK